MAGAQDTGLGSPCPWPRTPLSEEGGLQLVRILEECANDVAANNIQNANTRLEHISCLASPNGTAIQRIAAYFIEAFAERMMIKSFPGLYKALNSTKISLVFEKIHVHRLFSKFFPFIRVAYAITNQAIIEAMEGEKMFHIIDLYSFEADQWIDLFQTLCVRPEGPPRLKITGIHEQKAVLEQMALRLIEEAAKLGIPFQFIPIVSKLENLDLESLCVKSGEALAISSLFQLHSLLATDEEVLRRNSPVASQKTHKVFDVDQQPLRDFLNKDTSGSPDFTSPSSILSLSASPKMKNFLSSLRCLSPKLMVITEQEANHNGFSLTGRVKKALNYYAALFDCLDSTLPRESMERYKVEKMLFGEEIKNIIACEGVERKERHEKLEKWILRLEQIGFGRVRLSYHNMLQAGRYLRSYGNDGYNIKDENGCFVICWNKCPLFSISAWRFMRQNRDNWPWGQ